MKTNSNTAFERLFKIMVKPWIVVASLGLIIISFLYIDQPITLAAYNANLEARFPWLDFLTTFGNKEVYIIPIGLVIVVSRFVYQNRYWERRAWFMLICLLFSNLVCLVFKVMMGRARPGLLISDHLYGFFGPHLTRLYWSFPSGHTTTVMAIMFGLSALFPRYMLGFILFGFFVAASRVMLLQHYLSDVMMASYLALIEVGFLYYWLTTLVRDNKKRIL